MAVSAEVLGLVRLIPEQAFPVRTVRIVAADARHCSSRPLRIVDLVHGVAALPAFSLDPHIRGQSRFRVGSAYDVGMALSAALISFGGRQIFERRGMFPMALETFAVGNGFVHILSREALRVVAGITQVRHFAVEELRVLALVRGMAAAAHADLEGAVFFPSVEFFAHVAVKTQGRSRFHEQKAGFRPMCIMARGATASCHRFVPLLAAGKSVFVMALVAQLRLLQQKQLFRLGLMRRMTRQTIALSDRGMHNAPGKRALVVAGVAKVGPVGVQQLFCVLRMRIVANGAFSGNNRLMLQSGPIGDARLVVAPVAELGHREGQELRVLVRAVRIVAKGAEPGRRRKVNVLLCGDIFVVAFEAQVGHGHREQLAVVRGMRVVAGRALSGDSGLVLVTPEEERAAVAVIAQVRLFGLERKDRFVLVRVRSIMAGVTAFFHGRVQHFAFAHRFMAFVAVLLRGRSGRSGKQQQERHAAGRKNRYRYLRFHTLFP